MTNERDDQFHAYVLARRAGLVRTATLLTAGVHVHKGAQQGVG